MKCVEMFPRQFVPKKRDVLAPQLRREVTDRRGLRCGEVRRRPKARDRHPKWQQGRERCSPSLNSRVSLCRGGSGEVDDSLPAHLGTVGYGSE